MKVIPSFLFAGFCLLFSPPGLPAKQLPLAPLYDEAVLKKEFDGFMASLDFLVISKDYPMALRKLLSSNPEKQIQAVKTLAQTGEIEVIPWLLPFLDSENINLRIWTAASLDRLVSSNVLKRRDMSRPEAVVIRPLQVEDKDLRPIAWVVLKMFRKPDDGNTHAYAATMTRYLGLHIFKRELEQCLNSQHPAVANKARWALASLERQKEYENGLRSDFIPKIESPIFRQG